MEKIGSSINESATIVLTANADITGARAVALGVTDGKAALPEAGANVLGISIMETEEEIVAGADVDIQIKDIGRWTAAEAVAVGDELATDASGKAVKASSGDFIVGVALSDAAAAGDIVSVQITKSGYKS